MEFVKDEISDNLRFLLKTLGNPNWAFTASETNIDNLFECALKLEQIFSDEDISRLKELLVVKYLDLNFSKPVDILLESLLKNYYLNENLTLYSIEKYISLYSKVKFNEFLEKLLAEVELRTHLYKLIEEIPDVDSDYLRLNTFICEAMNNSDSKVKIQNTLKSQTPVLLKSIKYGDILGAQFLMDELILCLETHSDLRLWFMVMKEENLDVVLDLCDMHSEFLNAVFKFFDRFAEEVESNYDEELNIQYSHVNLDFEDFVKVFQCFLNRETVAKQTTDYLESKTLTDKNFCFWIDVKSCL